MIVESHDYDWNSLKVLVLEWIFNPFVTVTLNNKHNLWKIDCYQLMHLIDADKHEFKTDEEDLKSSTILTLKLVALLIQILLILLRIFLLF